MLFLNVIFVILAWATRGEGAWPEGVRQNDNLAQADPANTGCCATANCEDYRGKISVTVTGKTCTPWSEGTSTIYNPQKKPNSGLDSNFCRNPSGHKRTWCYASGAGNGRWEDCDICAEPEPEPEPAPKPEPEPEPEQPGNAKPCKNDRKWSGICQNGMIAGCGKHNQCWRQCGHASVRYCYPLATEKHIDCKSDQDCVDAQAGFKPCKTTLFGLANVCHLA